MLIIESLILTRRSRKNLSLSLSNTDGNPRRIVRIVTSEVVHKVNDDDLEDTNDSSETSEVDKFCSLIFWHRFQLKLSILTLQVTNIVLT